MRGVELARRTLLMAAQPAQRHFANPRCAATVDPHIAELRAQKDAARRAMRATLRAINKEALEEDSAYCARGIWRSLQLSCVVRAASGRLAVQRLLASTAFTSSKRVGVYVSCERLCEVNTRELLSVLLQPGAVRRARCCLRPPDNCRCRPQGQCSAASPHSLVLLRRRWSFIA